MCYIFEILGTYITRTIGTYIALKLGTCITGKIHTHTSSFTGSLHYNIEHYSEIKGLYLVMDTC